MIRLVFPLLLALLCSSVVIHAATAEVTCCFNSNDVSINVGDSVHWSGLSIGVHNVAQTTDSGCTFNPSGFHSGSSYNSFDHSDYTFTFNTAGTYFYGCVNHCASSNMKGRIVVSAAAPSTDATLSGLTASPASLSPNFAAATLSYTATVSYAVNQVTIVATKNNAAASVSGPSGAQSLSVGVNTFNIQVTAQDGTTSKTYVITITRSAASTNADLTSLTAAPATLSPSFTSSTTAYTASVNNSVASVTIVATASDSTANVNNTSQGIKALSVGINNFNILVTAQDGTTTKTYTLAITRAQSSDATLSVLSADPALLSPSFTASTTSYSGIVPFATTSITITATATNAGATVSPSSVGSKSVSVGLNTFNVVVTAQDGTTTSTYTLSITRAAASLSIDASLSTLSITQAGNALTLSPTFAPATLFYQTNTQKSDSVRISATKNSTAATLSSANINTDLSITLGTNNFSITVTAEDGATRNIYVVSVIRTSASAGHLVTPSLLLLTAVVAMLLCLLDGTRL